MNSFMKLAKECAEKGVANNEGGPFGAVIVDSQNLIYEYLKGNNLDLLNLQPLDRLDCIRLFEDYKKNNKIIY